MAEKKTMKKKSSKKKTSKKKVAKKDSKEKVCETFEVDKGDKEKVVKSCGEIEKKHATKKELKEQNKTLRNVLIGLGLLVVIFIAIILFMQSMSKFTYINTKFELTKEGSLLFYKTTLPVYYQGDIRDYNFFIRNDPRKLEQVEFDGKIRLLKNVVVNISDIRCDGDEVIAIANLVKLWDVLGADVIKDENATCDPHGRYVYLNIIEGDETKIVEKNEACYDMIIGNCEILEGTEKFMVETFVEVNKVKGRVSSLE